MKIVGYHLNFRCGVHASRLPTWRMLHSDVIVLETAYALRVECQEGATEVFLEDPRDVDGCGGLGHLTCNNGGKRLDLLGDVCRTPPSSDLTGCPTI